MEKRPRATSHNRQNHERAHRQNPSGSGPAAQIIRRRVHGKTHRAKRRKT